MAGPRKNQYCADIVDHDAVDLICNILATSSKGLQRIIDPDPAMPSYRTWMAWMNKDQEVRMKYACAREQQAEFLADEILEIVDTEEDSAKARVRMDARKWAASKLAPKKFGDKLNAEVTGKNGGAIVINFTKDDEGLL